MLPVADARAALLQRLSPVGVEDVPLPVALGRVLAHDVVARLTQPPFDAASMDGWAVRSADLAGGPTTLLPIGSVAAGYRFDGTVGPGEAVRIFTGAPLPAGADAVVMQEDVRQSGEAILVPGGIAPGTFVRRAGMDFAHGVTGLRAGRRLTARDIGLAAAMDHPWLTVRRRPVVALLPTGDEVVRPGDPRGPSQIVSANALALAAMVEQAGGCVRQLGIAPDRPEAIAEAARAARGADVLVTTGGASVGAHDFVQAGLSAEGLELGFWKVALRPGKPLLVGRLGEMQVLGLPGNPVSAMVCGILFLLPAIRALLGLPPGPETDSLPLARALPANDGREEYLRARLVNGAADPFANQDSAMISVMAAADLLVIRPAHAPAIAAGTPVPVIWLDRDLR
ncbi:MAG: molybdopterin molybdenumtransferase MoeA [Alphaproteobacteria bacterium]|nr:MAG: molybdopterin molybdenumtransferase MoeA [Alphaproteobacteria bacterium]